MTIGRYVMIYDQLDEFMMDDNRQVDRATVSVYRDGQLLGQLYPRRDFYFDSQQPMTIPGVRSSIEDDFYVLLVDWQDIGASGATFKIYLNPLVNWIWLGFGVLAFGTGIALLPERALSFAASRVSTEATATAGLLLLMLVLPSTLFAQPGMPSVPAGVDTQTSYYPRSEFEKQLQHEIVCTCGCGHITIAECRKDPCAVSHEMRGTVASHTAESSLARWGSLVVCSEAGTSLSAQCPAVTKPSKAPPTWRTTGPTVQRVPLPFGC